jgi:hypothetical protein
MREARRGGCFACGRNDGGRGKGSTSYRYKNIGRRYRQEIQAIKYMQEIIGSTIIGRRDRQENIGKRI